MTFFGDMKKRGVSIAVCSLLATAVAVNPGCGSIPDNPKVLPGGGTGGIDSGTGPDASHTGGGGGATGGTSGSGGTTTKDGGGTGGSASGGKGGTSGTGGTVGDGGPVPDGGDGGAVAPPVKCGASTCTGAVADGKQYPPCCTTDNKCGRSLETAPGASTCLALAQPGSLTTDCVAQEAESTQFYGCCRSDGTCGASLGPSNAAGFGCIAASVVGGMNVTCATSATDTCKVQEDTCTQNGDCCNLPGGSVCVDFGGASATCTEYCLDNSDCATGCCVELTSGHGACADASMCPKACPSTVAERTCDSDADCCSGTICLEEYDSGPRICRPKCTTDSDCKPEFCVADTTSGELGCTDPGVGLCTNTCTLKSNGACDDGGFNSDGSDCALGTDCADCGTRVNGVEQCDDSCTTSANGTCEDGGTGSKSAACSFGTDCTDCGARLGICSNSCGNTDGSCEDGSGSSGFSLCALGTDCNNCGVIFGGRGQVPCDGSEGTACQAADPNADAGDSVCECASCKWESGVDCPTLPNKCNGVLVSTCCAASNPCKLADDALCECGGWCTWDTDDCGTP